MSSFFIQGQLFKHSLPFLIDTGSAVSLLQSAVWNQSKPPGTILSPWVGNKLVGVNGTNLHIQGSANVTITVMNQAFTCTMVVVDDLTVDAILGLDFLEANHCTLNIGKRLLEIPSCESAVPVNDHLCCSKPISVYAILTDTQLVPAYSEIETMATVPKTCIGKPCVLEATRNKTAVMTARALVIPTAETIPVRLLNPYSEPTTVYKGSKIATLEEVDPITPISAVTATSSKDKTSSDLNNALWNIVSKSATKLDNSQQQALYKLLLQYCDIFSTDKHDLGYTNALKHQIDTGNAQPIRQRVRRIPPGQSKKLCHPWSGPFEVIKRLSDATYRIVDRTTKRNRQVVHFDRLKLCPPGTRCQVFRQPLQTTPLQSSSTTTVPFGTDLQLVDEDNVPRRYPERTHRPPVQYGDTTS